MPNQPAGSDAARKATQQRLEEQSKIQRASQLNRQQPQPPIMTSGSVELPKLGTDGNAAVEDDEPETQD